MSTNSGVAEVEISRSTYLRWIKGSWPDKSMVIGILTENADTESRNWPRYPRGAVRNLWVDFGRKVERATTPEECVDALFKVLKYLACPEPGWDGVSLKIVD